MRLVLKANRPNPHLGKRSKLALPDYWVDSYGSTGLMHMDLCGPVEIQSRGEKKYIILVVVDNYSRFTWTIFLSSTDETYQLKGI